MYYIFIKNKIGRNAILHLLKKLCTLIFTSNYCYAVEILRKNETNCRNFKSVLTPKFEKKQNKTKQQPP